MYVRQMLEDEPRQVEWRLHWILAVVLLRAVGHVLDKVDGAASPPCARLCAISIEAGPATLPIRNLSPLHQTRAEQHHQGNEFGMTEGPVPIMAALQRHDGFDVVRQALIEENIYRPMSEGEYEGEDGRTLIDEAIEWWRIQLDEVDARVRAAAPMPPMETP
jgi:hypothetical protein